MSERRDSNGPILPRWAEGLLARLLPPRHRDAVLGDFAECFAYRATAEGRPAALRWFWVQVVRSVPAFLLEESYFAALMLENYLRIALRNLTKRKFFSALNVGGLAIGLAACLLILQYVAFEYSFDRFHAQGDRLFRVTHVQSRAAEAPFSSAYSWEATGAALAEAVPELEAYTRVHENFTTGTVAVEDGQGRRRALREDGILYADSSFLSLFTFPAVRGEARAFGAPGTLLLTETAVRKYFGDADPVGKMMEVRALTHRTHTVAGVLQDVPANSHLKFELLLPMSDLLQNQQYSGAGGWDWSNFLTYVKLAPGASLEATASKMSDVVADHRNSERGTVSVGLQPLRDIHLYSDLQEDHAAAGSYRTVYFFAVVALFILAIAWINYINLSTARAVERAREVGVRKVVGARRGQVVAQFLFESMLTSLVAFVLALALARLALPYLNQLAGVEITASVWRDPRLWLGFVVLFGAGTLLASLYPALMLSSFHPAAVLKGSGQRTGMGQRLRRALIVFQFAASIALLTGTFIVYAQVNHLRGLDLGFDLEQTLIVDRPAFLPASVDYEEAREAFTAELRRLPAVEQVATSTSVPGQGFSLVSTFRRESELASASRQMSMTWVSEDFPAVYGLELAAGRVFSTTYGTDLDEAVLINEAAARVLGFDSPEAALDQALILGRESRYRVVGVLKNFHWMSAKQEIGPVLLGLTQGGGKYSVKVRTADLAGAIASVRRVYDDIFPGNPFEYAFADRFFDAQYKADRRFGLLFGAFAGFALLVACLGLVGLAAYAASQRTKEIGIRKTLGASVPGIVQLLLADFVKLVLAALVVAVPLLYLAAEAWLAGFAERVALNPWMFVGPGLVVLAAALLAAGYHTARVALADPVASLRYE